MSGLFAQINQLNQEAQKHREAMGAGEDTLSKAAPQLSTEKNETQSPTLQLDNTLSTSKAQESADTNKPIDNSSFVTSTSDVATSQSDVTKAKSSKRVSKELIGDALGKGSRIDLDKLRTVIEEIAAVKTNAYGFSVRMSEREQADIEEFILDTLRKEGIKGYEVSIAKLMRYAMRYMFRVHPQEFVTALRAALQVEESLSI